MKYLKKFDTHSDYATFTGGTDFILPNVSYCVNENEVHYSPYYDTILKFTAEEANSTIKLNRLGTATTLANASLQYSTDNGETWNDYTFTQQGTKGYSGDTITLENVGDSVKFKGANTKLGDSLTQYHQFVMSGKIMATGNITSLFGGDIAIPSYGCYSLFSGCTALTEAPELSATTLESYCYANMFAGCTSLTGAPALPATTLANNCYANMFAGCSALTTTPGLPATELANSCYYKMFSGCTSLTTAPELPATTLNSYCYSYMFAGCTSLTNVQSALPATTLTQYCYQDMFAGCTSLTTAPELPAMTLAGYCYYFMFYGCTSLTTAPELPATTLTLCCYQGMFTGCTSLTTAPELPAKTLVSNCYNAMFSGCSSLNYIKALFTTTPSTAYTKNWVYGVASAGTFVKNSSATWTTTGVNGVPTGWTVQTANE